MFDLDKLNWLNGHYVRELSVEDLAGRITDHLARRGLLPAEPTAEQRASVLAATPLVNERMQVLSEAEGMLALPARRRGRLRGRPRRRQPRCSPPRRGRCSRRRSARSATSRPWTTADIEATLRTALVDGLGLKPKVAFGPVRVAVTGRRVSPPLFESLELLGRDRSLARLRAALGGLPA